MEHQFLHLIIGPLQQPKCELTPREHSMYFRFLWEKDISRLPFQCCPLKGQCCTSQNCLVQFKNTFFGDWTDLNEILASSWRQEFGHKSSRNLERNLKKKCLSSFQWSTSLGTMTIGITTLSIKVYLWNSAYNTQHNNSLPLCYVSLDWVSHFIY